MTEQQLARMAKRRLAILRHAEEVTGNISLTCRYYGISYFLHDGDNEVVAVLRELGQEQAALAGGAPDALGRFRRLEQAVGRSLPALRFDLARQGDGYMVTAVPKYRGAECDRPILLHTRWTFPDTEAGREARDRIAKFFDYGGEVEVSKDYLESFEVDAPAGFGGTFHGGWLKLSSLPAEAGLPLRGDGLRSATSHARPAGRL